MGGSRLHQVSIIWDSRAGKTLHPDFNGLPTAVCLNSVYVAHHVSINRRRSVAAFVSCSGGTSRQTAEAGLAWLRFPAGLPSATQQQPATFRPEKRLRACRAPRQTPLVH